VRGLLTTPEHLTTFCPQRHVTPVITGLLGMTLLQEIQNIVTTIDGECLDVGRWTWSFEFEKRMDFAIPRSAPSSVNKTISRFPNNFFPMWTLIFCQHTIHQVPVPHSGMLFLMPMQAF